MQQGATTKSEAVRVCDSIPGFLAGCLDLVQPSGVPAQAEIPTRIYGLHEQVHPARRWGSPHIAGLWLLPCRRNVAADCWQQQPIILRLPYPGPVMARAELRNVRTHQVLGATAPPSIVASGS